MLTGLWEKELSISRKMAQPDSSTLIDDIKLGLLKEYRKDQEKRPWNSMW